MLSSRPPVKNLALLVACGAGFVAVAFAFSSAAPRRPATVNVRWGPGVADSARHALESTWQLTAAQHTEGSTYRYVLVDTSYDNIRALVTHTSVEDTANIDRSTYRTSNSPGLSRRQMALVGAFGGLLVFGVRRSIGIGTFWGIVGACTLAVVAVSRALPAVGAALLSLPHWILVAAIGTLGAAGAARGRVSVSARRLSVLVAAPPLVLVGGLAVLAALSVVGVSPFWRRHDAVSLVEAAYEGDRAEVVRLLAQGANPRDTALVDGATRSALEAAVLSNDGPTLQRVLAAAGPIDDGTRERLVELAERSGRTTAREVLSGAR